MACDLHRWSVTVGRRPPGPVANVTQLVPRPGGCLTLHCQPLLYARCRLARNDDHRPRGKRGGPARRRLAAPVGSPPGRARLLPTPPARTVPRHSPAEAVALVVIVPPILAPKPSGFRHSRADRAAALTTGGGP